MIINEIEGKMNAKRPQLKVFLFCLFAIFTIHDAINIRKAKLPIIDITLKIWIDSILSNING